MKWVSTAILPGSNFKPRMSVLGQKASISNVCSRFCFASDSRRSARYPRATPSPRRFPPPWSVEELDACLVVKDHAGQKLAYVYFEDEPGPRSVAKLLTRDGPWRIAANMAKLYTGLIGQCGGNGRARSGSRVERRV